jgi:hypothetical protein
VSSHVPGTTAVCKHAGVKGLFLTPLSPEVDVDDD